MSITRRSDLETTKPTRPSLFFVVRCLFVWLVGWVWFGWVGSGGVWFGLVWFGLLVALVWFGLFVCWLVVGWLIS